MKNLRIRQAILFFNENKKASEPKMNQTTLGIKVLPDVQPRTAGWYIGQWSDGRETGKLGPTEIYKIFQQTGVSMNFLFGIDEEKA